MQVLVIEDHERIAAFIREAVQSHDESASERLLETDAGGWDGTSRDAFVDEFIAQYV